MRQQFLYQRHGAGIIVAVGDALVQDDAQGNHLVQVRLAVFGVFHFHIFPADDDEAGVGSPVHQMVVARLQADGTQVRQENGGMVRIGADEALGCPAVLIQPKNKLYDQIDNPLGQLADEIHGACGNVGNFIIPLGLVDDVHDLLMVGIHGFLFIVLEERQSLFRFVVEFLFHRESDGNLITLIDLVVADKTVHVRAKHKRLAHGGADDMEEGVFVLRPAFVFPGKISFQRTKVNIKCDKGLVVGTVGHDAGHDPVHGRNILQPDCIWPVSPFSLFFLHMQKPPRKCQRTRTS